MSLVFNMVGGGGGGIKLTGIAITTPPTKTTYTQGETLEIGRASCRERV